MWSQLHEKLYTINLMAIAQGISRVAVVSTLHNVDVMWITFSLLPYTCVSGSYYIADMLEVAAYGLKAGALEGVFRQLFGDSTSIDRLQAEGGKFKLCK